MSTQKKNPSLLFYISAVAFFCLEIHGSVWYIVGIPLALVALFFLCKKINVAEELRCAAGMRVFCLLSALGTCIFGARNFHFLHILSVPSSRLRALVAAHGMLRPYTVTSIVAAILGAAVGLYFAYAVCIFVCKRLLTFMTEVLHGISRAEKITYGVLFAVTAALIAAVYLNSDVSFPKHPEKANNTVFSADCQLLIVSNNAFLSLGHGENDIRQPLFSVFASPFGAIPYLASLAVPFRWSLPLFTALANLALLLLSTLILSQLLRLSSPERIIFAIVSSLTFSHIAFSLFIEQYIVAVLYLFMLLYAYCEHKRLDTFALYAATGTLTTSCVAALFMAEPSPQKNPAAWIKRLFFLALGFVVLVVAFCRAEVFDFKDAVDLMRFTGAKIAVPFSTRLLQFFDSVLYYFVSPAAKVVFSPETLDASGNVISPAHCYYTIAEVTKLSVPGIIILLLCGASTFLNRRNVLARFSAFWIAFCFLLTCVAGWGCGTAENTLFLYALYFGWTYFVLLFLLVQNVAEVFRAKWLVSAVSAVACVVLLLLNIPSVKSMIDFAFTYYPL